MMLFFWKSYRVYLQMLTRRNTNLKDKINKALHAYFKIHNKLLNVYNKNETEKISHPTIKTL